METQVLYMDFIDNEGKNRSISIDDPRETVADTEIKTVMDLLIAKNIFSKFELVGIAGARLVIKTVENIEV